MTVLHVVGVVVIARIVVAAVVGKCVAGWIGTGALPIAASVLLSLEEAFLLLLGYSGGHFCVLKVCKCNYLKIWKDIVKFNLESSK